MSPDAAERSHEGTADPAVRAALARLAAGGSPDGGGRPPTGDSLAPAADPAAVVRAAETAAADLDAAAAFRTAGGLERLRWAVERAARRGDRRIARRGQRVLAGFERVRAALHAGDGPANARDKGRMPAGADLNHFHRGRGTPLGPAVEPGDE